MGSQFIASLAAAALVAGGFAVGAETRSMAALPRATVGALAGAAAAGDFEKCVVEVVRNRVGGTSEIERDQRSDGRCICRIFTGPSASNGSAEEVVSALLRDRDCVNAPAALPAEGAVAGTTGSSAGAGGAAGAGAGGGLGGAVLPAVFGLGAIGLGASLAGSSKG